MLLAILPVKTLADSGDIFSANITVGSNNAVPCIFKVLTEPADGKNGTVQIGDDWTAINTATQGELIIPEQVKRVKNGVELTYDVTVIGYKAFQSCQNLSGNLIIPSTITAIGNFAFYDCTGLNGTLTIPSTVTEIGNRAFYNCSNLTGNLVIPPLVTTIQYETFYNCKGLTGALSIPSNVKTIGASAFYGCEGFTGNLTIPSTVTTIGINAFYNCSGLTGNLEIPSGVKTIGNSAFSGCTGFTGNLTIPSTVTTIGSYAFINCINLSSLQFEPGINIDTIAEGAFKGCSGLIGSLSIPDKVTKIGESAFEGCRKLTGPLTIPDSVTTIGNKAFGNCTALTCKLTIPENVTAIGSQAFYNCKLEFVAFLSTAAPSVSANSFNGTYPIYYPSDGNGYDGGDWTYYSGRMVSDKEEKPNVIFTATGPDTGTLSGVASGMKYKINDGEWKNIDINDDINLTGLTACTITIVKKGNGSTTTDSEPQTITVTKAATPTAGKVDCTTIDNNNGKLTGLTTSMEYKLSTDSEWKAVTESEITDLASGTYNVRVKASGAVLASDMQNITIEAYKEPVTEIQNGGSVTGTDLDKLISVGKTLMVNGDKGARLVFSIDALKEIDRQTSGEIMVEIKDVSSAHQEKFPCKKVFSITVSSGSSIISDFGGLVTISLPYELRNGEREQDVTVWYLTSNGTITKIPCTYDQRTKLATFTVAYFSQYMVGVSETTPWVNPFSDVNKNDWFYSAVEFVNRNSLFLGTSDTNFSPDSPMTRAMLWTVLGRLNGSSFSGSDAFNSARIWAMGAGITDGTNPDANITREQVVTILWRYAGSPKVGGNLSKFSDAGSVASYATDAMAWAVENGIIEGANGALIPQDNATRAQVAAILQRFVQKIAK